MSPVSLKTMWAICGAMATAFFGIWAVFFALSQNAHAAIALMLAAALSVLFTSVQIHDRRIAINKAAYRKPGFRRRADQPFLSASSRDQAGI